MPSMSKEYQADYYLNSVKGDRVRHKKHVDSSARYRNERGGKARRRETSKASKIDKYTRASKTLIGYKGLNPIVLYCDSATGAFWIAEGKPRYDVNNPFDTRIWVRGDSLTNKPKMRQCGAVRLR